MKFTVYITLEKTDGIDQDEETMIDAFCGQIGKDNGARPYMEIEITDGYGEHESTYIVQMADDRP
jgi:hypothetical protein